MNTALEIKNLKKNYRKNIDVLKGISLSVQEGTTHALLGPNGAGKTTLLKCVMDFVRYSGDIRAFSKKPGDIKERIAYVSEEKALYRNMSVIKFLKICERISPAFNMGRAAEYISNFSIPVNKKISTLSTGQCTTLSMISGLSQDADLFLFDEPTHGMDPVSRVMMMDKIRERIIDGKTVFYTSHIIPEVEQTADSVSIIHGGQILFSGLIDDIKEKYSIVYINSECLKEFDRIPLISKYNERGAIALLVENVELYKIADQSIVIQKITPSLEDFFMALIRGMTNVL